MTQAGASAGSDAARASLAGRTIVVTRAHSQAAPLTGRLESFGARVVAAPCIATEAPGDRGRALAGAVGRLAEYSVVALTSPTGARRLLAALGAGGLDGRALAGVTVAAVGPGTAAVLAEAGVEVNLMPDEHVGEGLLDELGDPPHPGAQVLVARAEVARAVLPHGLLRRGWVVDDVAAYRTVTPPPDPEMAALVACADVVTFTSSSTVTGFLSRFGAQALPPQVVCMGPIAADTARTAGVPVDAVADPHSLQGLVDAVVELPG